MENFLEMNERMLRTSDHVVNVWICGRTQISYLFFFQAEDGIRDVAVTGVQTCALPILVGVLERRRNARARRVSTHLDVMPPGTTPRSLSRAIAWSLKFGSLQQGGAEAGDRKSVV